MKIKKQIYLWVVVAIAILAGGAGSANAAGKQSARQEIKANPALSANNYQAYPDRALPTLPAAPSGYKPFFINHYGRHGSRWLLSDRSYRTFLRAMECADRNGKLTPRGKEVLEVMRQVTDAAYKRWGELSDIGAEQHRGIAERMYRNFPDVFVDGATINARSTVIIRCILSMQNEVDMLYSLNPRLNVNTSASRSTMRYMNYTDTVVRRMRGDYAAMRKSYMQRLVHPQNMLKRLFTDRKFVADSLGDPQELMTSFWDVAANMQSHHQFENVNLLDLFSDDDIYNMWRYENIRWYLMSGNTPITKNRVTYMEANLLRSFIADADLAVDNRRNAPGASLRFGHESVLLPLCCLMGIDGADYSTTDLETLDNHWRSYHFFPMAGNVQLVYFAKPESNDILVLPLLNEHVATLPVATDAAPFYHWSEVREYFIDKLSHQPNVKY